MSENMIFESTLKSKKIRFIKFETYQELEDSMVKSES
jgi:hypothetical protein